jgi:hypothetical protein
VNIDTVIAQVKELAPVFRGNVAGAAGYAAVADQVYLALPAAYVLPGDSDGDDNTSMAALNQRVIERISIVVVFDNSSDRRGQSVASMFDSVRAAIRTALLNWRPDWNPLSPTTNRETRGLYEVSGRMIEFDRARLFYEWTYALDTTVTDADGWQVPAPALLTVQGTVQLPSGDTVPGFEISFPQ